jgi:hypothetical protein
MPWRGAQAEDFPREVGVVLEQHPLERVARARGRDHAREQRVVEIGVLVAQQRGPAEHVHHGGRGNGRRRG